MEDPPDDYKIPENKLQFEEILKAYEANKKARLAAFKERTARGFMKALFMYSDALQYIYFVTEGVQEVKRVVNDYSFKDQVKNIKKVLTCLRKIGDCCYRFRKIEEGIQIINKCIELGDCVAEKNIAYQFTLMCRLYVETGRYDIARKYLEKAIKADNRLQAIGPSRHILEMAERGDYGASMNVRSSSMGRDLFFRVDDPFKLNVALSKVFKMLKMREACARVTEINERREYIMDPENCDFDITLTVHYRRLKKDRRKTITISPSTQEEMSSEVVHRFRCWKSLMVDTEYPHFKHLNEMQVSETEELKFDNEKKLFERIEPTVLMSILFGDDKLVPFDALFDYYVFFKRLKMKSRCYLVCKQIRLVRYIPNLVYLFNKCFDKFEVRKEFVDDNNIGGGHYEDDDEEEEDGEDGDKKFHDITDVSKPLFFCFEREEYLNSMGADEQKVYNPYHDPGSGGVTEKTRDTFFTGFCQAIFNEFKKKEFLIMNNPNLFKLFEKFNLFSILKLYKKTNRLGEHNEFNLLEKEERNMAWDMKDLADRNFRVLSRDLEHTNVVVVSAPSNTSFDSIGTITTTSSNDDNNNASAVEQKEFDAHREILVHYSNCFFRMLKFGGMEAEEMEKMSKINMAFLKEQEVDIYLQFLYTGHFRDDIKSLKPFFVLYNHGEMYQETRLKRKCLHQIQMLSREMDKKNKLAGHLRKVGYILKSEIFHESLKEALMNFWRDHVRTPYKNIRKAITESLSPEQEREGKSKIQRKDDEIRLLKNKLKKYEN